LSSKRAAQGSYIQVEAQPCTYAGNLATTKWRKEHKVQEVEAQSTRIRKVRHDSHRNTGPSYKDELEIG
jgi:hypothetical protein